MDNPQLIITPKCRISELRSKISEKLLQNSRIIEEMNFSAVSVDDLRALFFLYSEYFFNNWFSQYKNMYWHPRHSFSENMTSAAGKCIRTAGRIRYHYEIRISSNIIFNYGNCEDGVGSGGLIASNRLEALQLVYEHELIHLAEFLYFGDSNCKTDRFKTMANNIFGHKSSYHDLPTNKDIAESEYEIKVGSNVNFEFNGEDFRGQVIRINRRATVLVKNSESESDNSYSKYYIPIDHLRKLE